MDGPTPLTSISRPFDEILHEPGYLEYQEELRCLIFNTAQTEPPSRDGTPGPALQPGDSYTPEQRIEAQAQFEAALSHGRRLEYLQNWIAEVAPWVRPPLHYQLLGYESIDTFVSLTCSIAMAPLPYRCRTWPSVALLFSTPCWLYLLASSRGRNRRNTPSTVWSSTSRRSDCLGLCYKPGIWLSFRHASSSASWR